MDWQNLERQLNNGPITNFTNGLFFSNFQFLSDFNSSYFFLVCLPFLKEREFIGIILTIWQKAYQTSKREREKEGGCGIFRIAKGFIWNKRERGWWGECLGLKWNCMEGLYYTMNVASLLTKLEIFKGPRWDVKCSRQYEF